MRIARREELGRGSIAVPVLGIVLLMASYVLMSEWQDLPRLIVSALNVVHWPASS